MSLGNDAVYIRHLYSAEVEVAEGVKELLSHDKEPLTLDSQRCIDRVNQQLPHELSDSQMAALRASIQEKIMVITGGPGTGKTTLLDAVIKVFACLGKKVHLAAPTGRAAKRMSMATGCEAKTLHRLLEYNPEHNNFSKNEFNTLGGDVIIIDEASMVDISLMGHLIKAVRHGASLILVGDVNQLSSVGPGAVLRDIIKSGVVSTAYLDVIFRQGSGSVITANAQRILAGRMPTFSRTGDFRFLCMEGNDGILEKVISLCKKEIPAEFGFDPVKDIQVLTPMHKGAVGTSNLNNKLQNHLNPVAESFAYGELDFRAGDKVMQNSNNYEKEVYNGDIGTIHSIDRENREVGVWYDGRTVAYDFTELDELDLAYAVSVHKSQGTEYPAVIIPLSMEHYRLLQRDLLYTGITRGKKLVVLVGSARALNRAVENNVALQRYTGLEQRLRKMFRY